MRRTGSPSCQRFRSCLKLAVPQFATRASRRGRGPPPPNLACDEPFQFALRTTSMNCLLRRLIAVATMLLLASPPGFCSVLPAHLSASRQASACVSPTPSSRCCRSCPADTPADSREQPAESGWRCCCARDAQLPHKPVPAPESVEATAFVTLDALIECSSLTVPADYLPVPSGPRLHVLLCVWRC